VRSLPAVEDPERFVAALEDFAMRQTAARS